MQTDFELIISPTELDLECIKQWLIKEREETGEGFYCNWGSIEKGFKNKQIICINENNNPIGFVVWNRREIYTEIGILEIKPNFRKKGIGEIFINKITEYFKQNEILVIKLFCEPRESEEFWKKMGFIQLPNSVFPKIDLEYYKCLVESIDSFRFTESNSKLELWGVEPIKVGDTKAKWCWELNFEEGKNHLVLPIIHPCKKDWNLRWTKNGKIIREGKVKYFAKTESEILFSPFIFITKLVE
jgi:N-acetylglutamate synthase-like GNAT family acetyltransferase